MKRKWFIKNSENERASFSMKEFGTKRRLPKQFVGLELAVYEPDDGYLRFGGRFEQSGLRAFIQFAEQPQDLDALFDKTPPGYVKGENKFSLDVKGDPQFFTTYEELASWIAHEGDEINDGGRRDAVYNLIDGERDYQEKRWGEGHIHEVSAYLAFMKSYVDRAIDEATHADRDDELGLIDYAQALDTVRKITALGVACMENHGAPARVED